MIYFLLFRYPVPSMKDAWSTVGRYNLLSRLLRGGLSGSGDVYHPANTTFKVCYYTLSFELHKYRRWLTLWIFIVCSIKRIIFNQIVSTNFSYFYNLTKNEILTKYLCCLNPSERIVIYISIRSVINVKRIKRV